MIKGFWHIALMNHWYSVVNDQLRIMLTSGLYGNCSEIKIGAVGSEKELDYLQRFILDKYDKLKLCVYSPNLKDYEFPTLALIATDKDTYSGFYFHTKGVSKPQDTCTHHWGAWLNEAILNRWQEHYVNLETYDLSGVNWLDQGNGYYSGNYCWFRSEIVQSLPSLSRLNKNNRYTAEHWLVSGKHRCFKGEFKECGLGRDNFNLKII